ncbi:MAG: DUF3387 domain-containing protein, partial [Halobacteriales archaeon]|nr:DUF3387 domain-containing protein [Halobacteriales archaeon]
FRRLQDLYESVSPDGRLIESGIQANYRWLARIHVAFERSNNRRRNPEDELREKTREIVSQHVDVREIKDQFPVYKIGEDHLEAVQEMTEPAARATSIAHATQDHLQPRVDRNPRYKQLSERVADIVEQWQSGNMADPDAVEALERLEREAIELEGEAERRGLSPEAFAVFAQLVDGYDEFVENEATAEKIARDIHEAVEENVDTGFEGWQHNQHTLNDIEIQIIDVLVKEHDLAALVKTESFVTDARDFVVSNLEATVGE